MRTLIDKIPPFLRNRYIVTLLIFVVWMLFVDQNDLITQIKLHRQLKRLEEEKAYYQSRIDEIHGQWQSLMIDDSELERLAREKYLMKKDSEDVFVLVAKDTRE